MNYIFKKTGDTFVVWLAPANRYMQLQEPAFRVLEDWDNKIPVEQIIAGCVAEYGLESGEARQFVTGIIAQLQSLVNSYHETAKPELLPEGVPLPGIPFTTKNYEINGKNFLFRYFHPDLQEWIHPGLSYLEGAIPANGADGSFDLFFSGDRAILQINGNTTWDCFGADVERYIGLVYLQLLNRIHQTSDDFWMGAVHASAVSAGAGAILFTAPSGSGKSTLAALLMKQGYQVLSDDFSPVSLNDSRIFPFPDGLSVKSRSLPVLKSYFPSLENAGERLSSGAIEVFLPIATGLLPSPAPVRAIVFVKYDAATDCELEMAENLAVMDAFLQQLWLPPAHEVASRFLDWFFEIPCYRLTYSDHAKMVEAVEELFHTSLAVRPSV